MSLDYRNELDNWITLQIKDEFPVDYHNHNYTVGNTVGKLQNITTSIYKIPKKNLFDLLEIENLLARYVI